MLWCAEDTLPCDMWRVTFLSAHMSPFYSQKKPIKIDGDSGNFTTSYKLKHLIKYPCQWTVSFIGREIHTSYTQHLCLCHLPSPHRYFRSTACYRHLKRITRLYKCKKTTQQVNGSQSYWSHSIGAMGMTAFVCPQPPAHAPPY